MPVIIPIRGTELGRVATEVIRKAGEIHTTQPQDRLFLKDVIVSGGKWLGTVADTTARTGFNAAFPDVGCWPGDECYQTNTASIWRCIANRGESSMDWIEFAGGGGGGGGSVDIRDVWLFQ